MPGYIEKLIGDKLFQIMAPPARDYGLEAVFFLTAGLFSLTGLGFAVYASHLWLRENFDPSLAAALTGLLCFLIASASAAIVLVRQSHKESQLMKVRREMSAFLKEVYADAESLLTDPVRENPKTSVFLACLAGLMLGEKLPQPEEGTNSGSIHYKYSSTSEDS